MPDKLAIFAACFALAMLFLPMQYTFTSAGGWRLAAQSPPMERIQRRDKNDEQIVLQHSSFFGRILTLYVKPVDQQCVNRLEKIYQ